MQNLSQNARLLLNQIRERLNGTPLNAFHYVEGIRSIAFGPLLGPDNIIPPTSKFAGQELQRRRQGIAPALEELVRNEFIIFHGYTEGHKTFIINPNAPN